MELPNVGYAEYLFAYAEEIGLYRSNGFGIEPISWVEINAWNCSMPTKLSAWELNTIHKISKAYVSSFNMSNEKSIPSPYQPEQFDREVVSNKVGSIFRALAKRKNRKSGFKDPQL